MNKKNRRASVKKKAHCPKPKVEKECANNNNNNNGKQNTAGKVAMKR
jgi:hypothetical protein